jgi:hypothetical protein
MKMIDDDLLLDPKQVEEWEKEKERIKRYRKTLPLIQELQMTRRSYEKEVILKKEKGIIIPSGDWHIGHEDFDAPRLEELIELYNQYKMTVILMGDLIDNFNVRATIMKPSQATMDLPDQKLTAEDYIKTFKDRVGGIIFGNHEERSLLTDGFTFSSYLAERLRTNDLGRFSRVNFITPRKTFSGFFAHKWKGHSMYHLLQPCFRARIRHPYLAGMADMVWIAHNHQPAILSENGINGRSGCLVKYDDYADSLGFTVNPNKQPAVVYDLTELAAFDDIHKAIKYYEAIE